MIVVTEPNATELEIDAIRERLESRGLRTCLARQGDLVLIACLGEVQEEDVRAVAALPGVASVSRSSKPYRLADRAFLGGQRTVVHLGSNPCAPLGSETLVVIAGPCAVEDRATLFEGARAVRSSGASALRGGAYKPRTSPYSFQGLGKEGLQLLAEARRATGLPVVTEVMDPRDVELVAEHADMLQVGARSMQHYPLLAELGKIRRPVLLKRGLSATLTELLLAAEYILAQGNSEVVLCERGIRTFETATRNTFDIAAIPVLQRETHLPVVVDPSHAAGRADLVTPLALAAVAAGADGLLVEVHPDPARARSDGEQSLTPAAFSNLMTALRALAPAVGRSLPQPRNQVPSEAAA
jgi:3-deoxy-7-phosphoheptulonate synthase